MKIHLTGRLICANDTEASIVRDHLDDHIRLTRDEPGCERFDIAVTDDPLIFQVDETFTSRADFETHQARTKASAWDISTSGIQRDFQIKEG